MVRTIAVLALVAGIAYPVASVGGDGPGTPPDGIVVVPPDPRDPRFGGNAQVEELPRVVTRVSPAFPDIPRRLGMDGTVIVQALIGEDGKVKDTRVVKSIPMFDAAAVEAVHRWTFEPAKSKGKPVAVWVAVPVTFDLHALSVPQAGGDPIDVFNERLSAAGDSAWARVPATIAIEFVGGADCACTRFSIEVTNLVDQLHDAEVVVTRDGIQGDLVRGERHQIDMRRSPEGIWIVISDTLSWRCREGRDQEEYAAEPCK